MESFIESLKKALGFCDHSYVQTAIEHRNIFRNTDGWYGERVEIWKCKKCSSMYLLHLGTEKLEDFLMTTEAKIAIE